MKTSKAIIASILSLLILVIVQVLSTVLTYLLERTGLPMAVINLIHAFFYVALTYVCIKSTKRNNVEKSTLASTFVAYALLI